LALCQQYQGPLQKSSHINGVKLVLSYICPRGHHSGKNAGRDGTGAAIHMEYCMKGKPQILQAF
jgi:hypothetical protein